MLGILLHRLQGYSNKALVVGMMSLSVALVLVGLVIWLVTRNQSIETGSFRNIDKIQVAASIFPVMDLVNQVGGDAVEVELILPPGGSPHTFEPSPSDITKMQASKAVFYIGHGLDNWSLSIADSAGIDQKIVLDQQIDFLIAEHDHHEDEDESLHSENPHYWLSVANVMLMGMQVRDALIQLYPEESVYFEQNYETFASNMAKFDARLRERMNSLENRNLVTYHDAWGYFARDYGFEIVASFEPSPGKQPSPEFIRQFTQVITQNNIQTVYTEPQLSSQSLQTIANDLGVTVMQLDPLGGQPGRDSYQALMEYNVDQLIIGQR